MRSLQRVLHVRPAVTLTLALVGTLACTTAPRPVFSGFWLSQIPAGSAIVFKAQQRGSTVTGNVGDYGPLGINSFLSPITGTLTNEGVTLAFSFPPGTQYGP